MSIFTFYFWDENHETRVERRFQIMMDLP